MEQVGLIEQALGACEHSRLDTPDSWRLQQEALLSLHDALEALIARSFCAEWSRSGAAQRCLDHLLHVAERALAFVLASSHAIDPAVEGCMQHVSALLALFLG